MAAVAEDEDAVAVAEEDKDLAATMEEDYDGCGNRRQRCSGCNKFPPDNTLHRSTYHQLSVKKSHSKDLTDI